jgi:alpha-2-macroglobulin
MGKKSRWSLSCSGWSKARQAATACLAGIYDARTDAIFAMTACPMLRQPTASIEADRRSPLVCVTFDAKLDTKQPAALETYVFSKNGAERAARINDNQLCVEGFPHGQKDQLTIHPGLRGANALLRKEQTVDLDVRDRPRRVAFPSSGLILALTGTVGLPIETVNLDKVRALPWAPNGGGYHEVVVIDSAGAEASAIMLLMLGHRSNVI